MDDNDNDIEPEDFGLQSSIGEMGKMGLSIYRAVIRDGGTRHEAFDVTGAFFAGSMKATMEDSNDD